MDRMQLGSMQRRERHIGDHIGHGLVDEACRHPSALHLFTGVGRYESWYHQFDKGDRYDQVGLLRLLIGSGRMPPRRHQAARLCRLRVDDEAAMPKRTKGFVISLAE